MRIGCMFVVETLGIGVLMICRRFDRQLTLKWISDGEKDGVRVVVIVFWFVCVCNDWYRRSQGMEKGRLSRLRSK